MLRASVLAILAGSLGTTLVVAQRCQGFASFQGRPVQPFASALLGQDSRWYTAGVAVGGSGAFAQLQLGSIDVDTFSASSGTIGGGVGYQLPMNERGTAQLCPMAQATFAKGPKDINGTGFDYSETDVSFGLAAGVMVTAPGQQVEIVPTASIMVGNASNTLTRAQTSESQSQSFGRVDVGVGLVLGQDVSVTPWLGRPFGVSGTSTTFGIRVAFAIGGGRSPVTTVGATSCAGLAGTDSTVYDTTQVSERPSVRSAPELTYPPIERERGIEGRVIVDVVIGADGKPDQNSAHIVQNADPAMDRAALRWIKSVSYWPACRDAHAVRVRVSQPVDFCVFGCRRGKS